MRGAGDSFRLTFPVYAEYKTPAPLIRPGVWSTLMRSVNMTEPTRLYVLTASSRGYRELIWQRIQQVDDSVSQDDKAYGLMVRKITELSTELGEFGRPSDATVLTGIGLGRAQLKRDQVWAAREDAKLALVSKLSPLARDLHARYPHGTPESTEEAAAASVVYYIRKGDLVKVGTTTNFRRRMSILKPDEILAVEPGAYTLEKQMHRRFRAFRVPGMSEWFRMNGAIRQHVKRVVETYGPPPSL